MYIYQWILVNITVRLDIIFDILAQKKFIDKDINNGSVKYIARVFFSRQNCLLIARTSELRFYR